MYDFRKCFVHKRLLAFTGAVSCASLVPQLLLLEDDGSRAKCVADCAEKHPDLGPAYDACVAGCPLQILGIQPATNAMYPPVPPEFVQQAIDAALEIHALSVTNPGTPEIAVRLGEFHVKSYKREQLRVRFTEPFFLNSLVDLAIEPEITPELSEHLQDLVLFVINDGEFVERPAAFRAGMLALARNLASTSEDAGQVEAIIMSQDLWEEVEEVGRALGIIRAGELVFEVAPKLDFCPFSGGYAAGARAYNRTALRGRFIFEKAA